MHYPGSRYYHKSFCLIIVLSYISLLPYLLLEFEVFSLLVPKLLLSFYCHKIRVSNSSCCNFTYFPDITTNRSFVQKEQVQRNRGTSIKQITVLSHFVTNQPHVATWRAAVSTKLSLYLSSRSMSVQHEKPGNQTRIKFKFLRYSFGQTTIWRLYQPTGSGVAVRGKRKSSYPEIDQNLEHPK